MCPEVQAQCIPGHRDLFLPLGPWPGLLAKLRAECSARCEGNAVAQAATLLWVPEGEEAGSPEAAEHTPRNSFESRISNMAASAPYILQDLTTKGWVVLYMAFVLALFSFKNIVNGYCHYRLGH